MQALLRISALAPVVALALPAAAQTEGEEIDATEATTDEAAPTSASEDPAADRSPIDGVVGHLGIGYFSGSAPVGARYWMDRESAIDLGVAINFSTGDVESHRYGVEAGWVLALAHYQYAVVFSRLGLGLLFEDTFGDESGPARWDLNGNLFLGAELFLGAFGFPNVSLQGGYGLQANYTYQGGSAFAIGTVQGGLSVVAAGTVGFHIYL